MCMQSAPWTPWYTSGVGTIIRNNLEAQRGWPRWQRSHSPVKSHDSDPGLLPLEPAFLPYTALPSGMGLPGGWRGDALGWRTHTNVCLVVLWVSCSSGDRERRMDLPALLRGPSSWIITHTPGASVFSSVKWG